MYLPRRVSPRALVLSSLTLTKIFISSSCLSLVTLSRAALDRIYIATGGIWAIFPPAGGVRASAAREGRGVLVAGYTRAGARAESSLTGIVRVLRRVYRYTPMEYRKVRGRWPRAPRALAG